MIKILALVLLLTVSPALCGIPAAWLLRPAVYENPTTEICKPLWSREGSICNDRELIEVARNDEAEIQAARIMLHDEIDNMDLKLHNEENKLNNAQHESLLFYKQFKEHGLLQQVKKDIDSCAAEIIPARRAALCYICTKDYSKYLMKEKAVISEEHCGKMVSQCYPFFKFSMGLIGGFVELGNALHTDISNWKETLVVQDFNKAVSAINTKVNNANLMALIQQYQSGNTDKVQCATQLCGRLFSLRKRPLLWTIGKLINLVSRHIGDLVKILNRYSRKGRVLQSSPDLSSLTFENPFESDVGVLRSQDNMFTSFDGTRGSSQDQAYSNTSPMNLTLAFP